MYIIHKRVDGGVSITAFSQPLSLEQIEQHAQDITTSEKDFISYRIVSDDSLIPKDRYFRNAWTDDNPTDTVDIDMNKAINIKKDKLREIRKPLLEKLDVEYIKALEQADSDKITTIINKKQELRDITNNLPDNIEDLKNFLPNCLNNFYD